MVGISWVPAVGRTPFAGGICQRHQYFPRSTKALPAGWYSLNAVVVSQVTGGQRLIDGLMSLTVTHELGHSFGAVHDDDFPDRPDCKPGVFSRYGNYIMAATVPSFVNHANNWMFSPCSRQSMQPVISDRFKTACFRRRPSSYCGNAVVEDDEECDCGTTVTCDVQDKCCLPLSLMHSFRPESACKLKAKGTCSPRVQLCCTGECTATQAGVTCRNKTDCLSQSLCDGRSPSCPAPRRADDGTSCAGGLGQCKAGVCSVSACQQAGLVDCLCRRPVNHACSLCCRCADAPEDACVPARWLALAPASQSLLLPPGSACFDAGRCDNDGRCVSSPSSQDTAV